MSRDLPYVGVTLSPQVKPNSDWYLRSIVKSNANTPTSNTPSSLFTSISDRTYSFSTSRGRTYELGRIETGECSLAVNNSDGLFDPNNSSSALYPNVLPYRPVAINCAYPLTGNILNDNNLAPVIPATSPSTYNNSRISVSANDSNFEIGYISNWYVLSGTAPIAWSADVHSGSYSMRVANATTAYLDVPVVAGKQTCISLWYKMSGATTTSTLGIFDGGYINATTAATATVSMPNNSSTFTQVYATLTPQSPKITIALPVTGGAAALYVDDVQVEFGATPSTNVVTGPTVYSLFNGFVERYPQTYQAPNRGQVNMVATDAISSMSQNTLGNIYEALVLQDASPALYYYPLSEQSGSLTANNNSIYSQQPLVPWTKGTTTAVTFGDTNAATIVGASTTGVMMNRNSGTGTNINGTWLVNDSAANIQYGTNDTYTFSMWVKFNDITTALSGPVTFFVASGNTEIPLNGVSYSGSYLGISLNTNAASITATYFDYLPTTAPTSATKTIPNFLPSVWYFISASVTWNGTNASVSINIPVIDSTTVTASVATTFAPQFNTFGFIGAGSNTTTSLGAIGTSFAHLTVNKGAITASTYDSVGRYGLYGNSTGTRFKNMVNAYSGMTYLPYATDYGKSFMQNAITEGTELADYVQTIADTENGTWYVDGEGFVTFKDRWSRLQKLVPSVVFGDGTGETPYEGGDLLINFDPTYVLNDVMVNRTNGATIAIQDQTSVASYYPRSYSRTIQNLSDSETADAANFLVSRYKDPHARPETLTLTPARNPSVFPVALSLEIGDLVRVNKRPIGAPAISIDCFIEKVEHSFDAQSGDWTTRVSLSPTIVYYWNAAALRATTTGAAVAGSYVFTKGSTASAGLATPRDIRPGQLLQFTLSGTTYVDCVSGAPTETSTTVTVPAYRVGSFTNGSKATFKSSTLVADIKMDYTGTVTLSDSNLSGGGFNTFLIDEELVTGSVAGSTLTITARAQYGTIQTAAGSSSTYTASHLSGATVYGFALGNGGNVATGTVVTELLPNQLTRIPYSPTTNYTDYDLTSKLGSWTGVLKSGTVTTTTPASGIKYNAFTMFALTDGNNYPSSDLCIGQMLSVLNTAGSVESVGIIATGLPASTDQSWTLTVYKITDSGQTVNAAISPDATTVTCSGNVTASAILIGNEWMQVTAGSGTSTLTVVRGTPDAAVYGVKSKAAHYQYDKIYTVVNAGVTNTYAQGNSVIEGYNISVPVIGTARLGY